MKEITISSYLDKFNPKDIEIVSKYIKLDINLIHIINGLNIKDIDKYLRKKKIKKLK